MKSLKFIVALGAFALIVASFVALGSLGVGHAATGIGYSTLTTTFEGGNGCFGNMFDVTVGPGTTITGFDQNLWTMNPQTINVYYKYGSYVGSETTPGDWTLAGTFNVMGAGDGLPTHLELGYETGIDIPPGWTVGIYIDTSFGNNYTNGSAIYSNDEIEISTGAGLCGTFSSHIDGRIWNGTVYYAYTILDDPEPEPEVPAVNFPNKGEVMISAGAPVYAYAAAGEYMTGIVLPADYDGNGYDTYTVTGTATVAGETWYAIWVGGPSYLWVPASQVTVLR